MKARKYFLSILSPLLLMMFTQATSAHMLFTYESSVMNWMGEKAYYQDGTPIGMDFLAPYTFQFDVTLITPDIHFDLDEMEMVAMEFDNPIVNISSYSLFHTISIERSRFWVEAYKYEGKIYTDWMLTFDISDNTSHDDMSLQASIMSRGNSDLMSLHVDNFRYTRTMIDVVVDVDAEFYGEYWGEYTNEYSDEHPNFGRFLGKHISVPEPLSPILLLLGLTGIFAARKISKP